MIKAPKIIGTVGTQELQNISSNKPWEEIFTHYIPISGIGTPNGFMFTQGSACGSMATTSILGHTYNSDFYLWRKDNDTIDRDRYTTNTENDNLVIYLMPKDQTPNHHVKPSDQLVKNLPIELKNLVKKEFDNENNF